MENTTTTSFLKNGQSSFLGGTISNNNSPITNALHIYNSFVSMIELFGSPFKKSISNESSSNSTKNISPLQIAPNVSIQINSKETKCITPRELNKEIFENLEIIEISNEKKLSPINFQKKILKNYMKLKIIKNLIKK